MANVKIYQLAKDTPYRFEGWETAQENDFSIDDYKMVFECERDVDSEHLEDIWEEFNISRPKGFEGRSLSTSDIIELDGDKYYINQMGFKKI